MSLQYALKNGIDDSFFSMRVPYRIDVVADISGPSKTRQEFMDECDVNFIMKKYDETSVFPFKDPVEPVYYDFVGMPDLQDALHELKHAEEAFMSLPAKVRKEFDNDPVRFVEFAASPDNLEQMRTWGLAEPAKAPDPPMRVEVVNAPPIVPSDTGAAPKVV